MNKRKVDFLNYIKALHKTTLSHHHSFLNKWYDLFQAIDDNEYNSISIDSLTDSEYYVMNYCIPHVGSYKIYFNIDHIIQSKAYLNSPIHQLSQQELDYKRVNHPIPFDMNIYLLNQFQTSQKNIQNVQYYPIITDSCMDAYWYTVIDGNHKLEMSLREQEKVNIKYIPFHQLDANCYGNMFSFLLHQFMNEFYSIVYPNYQYSFSTQTPKKKIITI